MKGKVISIVSLILAILLAGLLLPGCSGAKIAELEAQVTESGNQIEELEVQLSEKDEQILDLEKDIEAKSSQIIELVNQTKGLQAKLAKLPRNPTYQELMVFLKEDKTNEEKYSIPDFVIFRFTANLNKNAEKKGIRTGWVRLDIKPHFRWYLIAFQTTDKGLIFIHPLTDEVVPELVVGEDFKQRDWTVVREIESFVIVW